MTITTTTLDGLTKLGEEFGFFDPRPAALFQSPNPTRPLQKPSTFSGAPR
jgi:hypothetical protein